MTLTSGLRQVPYLVSPDGSQVVFSKRNRASEDLFSTLLEGGRAAELLFGTEFNERNADISPDGRWVVYQPDTSGQDEVYVRPFPDVDSR